MLQPYSAPIRLHEEEDERRDADAKSYKRHRRQYSKHDLSEDRERAKCYLHADKREICGAVLSIVCAGLALIQSLNDSKDGNRFLFRRSVSVLLFPLTDQHPYENTSQARRSTRLCRVVGPSAHCFVIRSAAADDSR